MNKKDLRILFMCSPSVVLFVVYSIQGSVKYNYLIYGQYCNQPKFDFKRATLFGSGHRLSKHLTRYGRKFGGHAPRIRLCLRVRPRDEEV